jgi:hypothetical protein
MTNQVLGKKRLAKLRETLDLAFAVFTKALNDPAWYSAGTIHRELTTALSVMRELGLRSYQGKTRRELKLLHDYIGRMSFDRHLELSLSDLQTGATAGLNESGDYSTRLPIVPRNNIIWFRLVGLNESKILVYRLGLWTDLHRPNRLTPNGVNAYFGSRDGDLHTAISKLTLHYPARDFYGTHIPICPDCGSSSCRRQQITGIVALRKAYAEFGISGVWHRLDKLWADFALARPLNRPLNPQLIEVQDHHDQRGVYRDYRGARSRRLKRHQDRSSLEY